MYPSGPGALCMGSSFIALRISWWENGWASELSCFGVIEGRWRGVRKSCISCGVGWGSDVESERLYNFE